MRLHREEIKDPSPEVASNVAFQIGVCAMIYHAGVHLLLTAKVDWTELQRELGRAMVAYIRRAPSPTRS